MKFFTLNYNKNKFKNALKPTFINYNYWLLLLFSFFFLYTNTILIIVSWKNGLCVIILKNVYPTQENRYYEPEQPVEGYTIHKVIFFVMTIFYTVNNLNIIYFKCPTIFFIYQ